MKEVPKATNEISCSFCGATKAEAGQMVAGPQVHICGRCAIECAGLVTPDRVEDLDKNDADVRLRVAGLRVEFLRMAGNATVPDGKDGRRKPNFAEMQEMADRILIWALSPSPRDMPVKDAKA